MIRAAIYARKSTDQTGVSEDAKSVGRQIQHAKACALRKGWTLNDEHIFVDDGISGAEFGDRRPGLERLLAQLNPRPPFQILIMSEESRLGRESIEVSSLLKRLSLAGVVVHCYLDDKAVLLDTPTDKVMLALRGFTDESERTRAAQRTYDAMRQKAQAGYVTGGRVFGYRNIEILSGALDSYGRPKRDHVERQIDEEEAAVVRQIFRLCAEGKGMVSIARRLNDNLLPAPRNSQGLKVSWSPSSVRSVLFRRLYLGEVIWNKTKKRNPWGIAQPRKRPESEWLTILVPQLRIVEEADWKAAHDRLNATRQSYLRGTAGQLWGRPASSLSSKYLLTGLVSCGVCGGSLFVKSSSRKGGRVFFYQCSNFHNRGRTACTNSMLIPMDAANTAVLQVFEQEVLHPDVIDVAVKKAIAKFKAAGREWAERQQTIHTHITAVDGELRRLVAAISAGGDIPALVDAVKVANDRRTALTQALADSGPPHTEADYDELEAELKAHFRRSWETLMTRQVVQARQILAKLFGGERVPFIPTRSGIEFSGVAHAGRLLIGPAKTLAKTVVSPTGFEPVLPA